jgi:hypothetical protein
MPTPALADVSQGTARQDSLTATEGRRHDGSPTAAEAVPTAHMPRHVPLCEALEALTTLPALDILIREMPESATSRIDRYLDEALRTLRRFADLWEAHRHGGAGHLHGTNERTVMVPDAAVRVQELQQSTKPTQGRTRRKRQQALTHAAPQAKTHQPAQTAQATTETGLSQPDLLLAAIRTAPQPLTIEALRQMPGVDGSRLKRTVSRLVAQGKIQETPAGYVVVPA